VHADDEPDETEFDFRMPGGVGHLVDTVLKEAGVAEEEASATLSFPKQLKKPESREQPTMLIDGQQASIDHAVAASFIVESNPLPPPHAVVTDDLVLPPASISSPTAQPTPPVVIIGKPILEPESSLALDIEAIAARPARAPTWTPVQAPAPPESAGLPRAFWFLVAAVTLALIVYGLLR
jgi:hypothetical protein